MRFLRLTFLITLIGALSLITSCGPDDNPEPSIQQQNLALMSKKWIVESVYLDNSNNNKTSQFTGMTITISGTFNATSNSYNYKVENRTTFPNPWKGDLGTWSFSESAPDDLIIRDDGVEMNYFVNENKLTLDFDIPEGGGYDSRTAVVVGTWHFEFVPN